MLYLLPKKQKKDIKTEYNSRVIYTFLFLLSFVFLLWAISLIPSFAYIQIEKKVLKPKEDIVAQLPLLENGESFIEYTKEINKKIDLLSKSEYVVSDLIKEIVERQTRAVRLSLIEFMSKDGVHYVKVGGIANTRESLVEFSNLLEESEYFVSVDVPFSSFTQSSNIPFAVDVKLSEI